FASVRRHDEGEPPADFKQAQRPQQKIDMQPGAAIQWLADQACAELSQRYFGVMRQAVMADVWRVRGNRSVASRRWIDGEVTHLDRSEVAVGKATLSRLCDRLRINLITAERDALRRPRRDALRRLKERPGADRRVKQ